MKIELSKDNEADIIKLHDCIELLHTIAHERNANAMEKLQLEQVERYIENQIGYLTISSIVS